MPRQGDPSKQSKEPATAIHEADNDGNSGAASDVDWRPLIQRQLPAVNS